MTKTIHKISLLVFILSVIALTFIAILSIWEVFSDDAFWKSVATVVTVGGSAALIMGAASLLDKYVVNKPSEGDQSNHME